MWNIKPGRDDLNTLETIMDEWVFFLVCYEKFVIWKFWSDSINIPSSVFLWKVTNDVWCNEVEYAVRQEDNAWWRHDKMEWG